MVGKLMERAFRGDERLWIIFWYAGIPVALISGALVLVAERLRASGASAWGWGDVCDASRFLVYLAWFIPAWRCSKNVERAAWTPLARVALAAGLVLSAMF
jgi:hypothetical protein